MTDMYTAGIVEGYRLAIELVDDTNWSSAWAGEPVLKALVKTLRLQLEKVKRSLQ